MQIRRAPSSCVDEPGIKNAECALEGSCPDGPPSTAPTPPRRPVACGRAAIIVAVGRRKDWVFCGVSFLVQGGIPLFGPTCGVWLFSGGFIIAVLVDREQRAGGGDPPGLGCNPLVLRNAGGLSITGEVEEQLYFAVCGGADGLDDSACLWPKRVIRGGTEAGLFKVSACLLVACLGN